MQEGRDYHILEEALEVGLQPLAVTALEDKLQEQVPETIRALR